MWSSEHGNQILKSNFGVFLGLVFNNFFKNHWENFDDLTKFSPSWLIYHPMILIMNGYNQWLLLVLKKNSLVCWHHTTWNFFWYFDSSTNAKKWEQELINLKTNNQRLTAALQESSTNVDEWRKQLSAYKVYRLVCKMGQWILTMSLYSFWLRLSNLH